MRSPKKVKAMKAAAKRTKARPDKASGKKTAAAIKKISSKAAKAAEASEAEEEEEEDALAEAQDLLLSKCLCVPAGR